MKINLIECACGCGSIFNEYDIRGRKRKYLSGHNNSRINHISCMDTAICKTCGVTFSYYATKTSGVFCSKKCQHNHDYFGSVWEQNGYLYYQKGRLGKKKLVHRMICGLELGDGKVVHHKDSNKTNNSPDNIEIYNSQSDHMYNHWNK